MATQDELRAAFEEGRLSGQSEASQRAALRAEVVVAVRNLLPGDAKAEAFCAALESGKSVDDAKLAAMKIDTTAARAQADRDFRRQRLDEIKHAADAVNAQHNYKPWGRESVH